ncbi:lipoprotein insertase outer membrane protein LolB [Marinomonas pollencensis]|uniref:Outer-membrane lipoprotein LolB n=1 Tax=Marinomonas pollencensis TaxID=491954 RepID=A0A3E0DMJ3_9GAMM|nr:lipoprotein insertase outer membrane protein LolB [Marinomonas pollencensis]REG83010.1 outer membrane lipoprotein LolB [Marinomonas pollencensis]
MMLFRVTLLAFLATLLAACTSQPQKLTPPPASVSLIKQWEAQGRVGIRTENDAVSGNFNWQHSANTFDLRIYGPFGQGSTELSKNKDGKVVLAYEDKTVTGYDAEQMLQQRLGWQFPVRQVSYWIRGLPYPNTLSKISYQQNSDLPSEIIQDGWTISYQKFADIRGLSLPQKMQVSRPPYRVNLIITQWTIQ